MMDKEKNDQQKQWKSPSFLAIGILLGVIIGAATDNLGLWLPLGVSVGLCADAAADPLAEKHKTGKK